MQRRTHLVFGFLLSSLLWSLLHIPGDIVVMAWIGSAFPDLDYKWRKVKGVTHRQTLHNLWSLTFITLAIAFSLWYLKTHYLLLPPGMNPWMLGFGFAIGFLSHLLLDSTTKMGVIWLHPLRKHPHWKGPMVTGSLVEKIIQVLIMISILVTLVFPNIR